VDRLPLAYAKPQVLFVGYLLTPGGAFGYRASRGFVFFAILVYLSKGSRFT
jgi:hypothetical protein